MFNIIIHQENTNYYLPIKVTTIIKFFYIANESENYSTVGIQSSVGLSYCYTFLGYAKNYAHNKQLGVIRKYFHEGQNASFLTVYRKWRVPQITVLSRPSVTSVDLGIRETNIKMAFLLLTVLWLTKSLYSDPRVSCFLPVSIKH